MIRALLLGVFLAVTAMPSSAQQNQTAIFAGGCFWCVESDFDKVPGVLSTTSGYIGGQNENPTYENHPGHREAVEIAFDPALVSYEQLLAIFFRSVDPTDGDGQFCDRGHAYTTAVYAVNDAQLNAAQAAEADASKTLGGAQLATEIAPAPRFWPAEEYHQDYYKKNPLRYRYYRYSCGRDARVQQVWGAAAHYGIPAGE